MEKLLYSLLTIAIVYGAICLWMFFRQNSYVYFPHSLEKNVIAQIQKVEGFEPWTGINGIRFGWKKVDTINATHAIVFLHGNGSLSLERLELVKKIRAADPQCAVYLLEYPGYADMPGSPSEKSIVILASAAIESLSEKESLPIYLLGESLGTGVACAVAAKKAQQLSGLLLLTPFNSLVSTAAIHYPWLPVSFLLHERFESTKNLKSFTKPVAIVVAEDDEVVPAKLGKLLFENYSGPKYITSVKGGHNDAVDLLSVSDFRMLLNFLQHPVTSAPSAAALSAP